jgi:putative phosphoesterase
MRSIPSSQSLPCRIAVISDTHTSTQYRDFHPALLARLEDTPPDLILHAGDITLPESLVVLSKMAPTFAVRGNRDILGFSDLPDVILLQVGSHRILLAHGHGPLFHYLFDKVKYILNGYRFERYRAYLQSIQPESDIHIFGHTHVPVSRWIDGKLFFNPGTAGYPARSYPHSTMGWITIQMDGSIQAKIQYLDRPKELFPEFG